MIYEVPFYFYMKGPEGFEPIGESAPDAPRAICPEYYRTELSRPALTVKRFVTDECEASA